MKYAVDSIIDEIVKLENIATGEIKEIDIEYLPDGVKEGDIINEFVAYEIDYEEINNRKKMLRDKLNRLKGINKDE